MSLPPPDVRVYCFSKRLRRPRPVRSSGLSSADGRDRFTDVGGNLRALPIEHTGATVVALIRDHFLDHLAPAFRGHAPEHPRPDVPGLLESFVLSVASRE